MMNIQLDKKINICIIGGKEIIKLFSDISDLLKYSLIELGFDVTLSSANVINDDKYINILIGGHLLNIESLTAIPKNTIFLNTEQLDSLVNKKDKPYTDWYERTLFAANNFVVWDYSMRNVMHFKNHHNIEAKHLVLGFQKEVKRIINKNNKDIDILFYGSMNERRMAILAELQKRGINVVSLLNVYGEERDKYIARAKMVLNIHYFDAEIFEIVRCSYLMNNEIAIVSEINEGTHIDPCYRNGVYGVPYDKLVETCVALLKNEEKLDELRFNALDTMLKIPQSKIMKEMLNLNSL